MDIISTKNNKILITLILKKLANYQKLFVITELSNNFMNFDSDTHNTKQLIIIMSQSAGAVEYTDCTSAEG